MIAWGVLFAPSKSLVIMTGDRPNRSVRQNLASSPGHTSRSFRITTPGWTFLIPRLRPIGLRVPECWVSRPMQQRPTEGTRSILTGTILQQRPVGFMMSWGSFAPLYPVYSVGAAYEPGTRHFSHAKSSGVHFSHFSFASPISKKNRNIATWDDRPTPPVNLLGRSQGDSMARQGGSRP